MHSHCALTFSALLAQNVSEREGGVRKKRRWREGGKERERETDRQTETESERDRETDRETDRQTGRDTDRQAGTQRQRQTDRGFGFSLPSPDRVLKPIYTQILFFFFLK